LLPLIRISPKTFFINWQKNLKTRFYFFSAAIILSKTINFYKKHLTTMKKIMKSAFVIATIVVWQFIPVSGFSQACVNCIDSMQNVSVGFLNTIHIAETQQTALGYNNTTGNNNAVAVGSMSKANGSHSYVFGSFSESKGIHSYVIGSNSEAKTINCFTIGVGSKSMSTSSMAIGNYVETYGQSSIVLGMGSYQSELVHNIPHSLAVGFGSTIPTFFVGGSPSTTGTGNVGIATTDPKAKLHVNGDFQVGDVENPQEIRLYGSINASGENATAFGNMNSANGLNSFAVGLENEVLGNNSVAIGYKNKSNSDYSFSIGLVNEAKGQYSLALGRLSEADGGDAIVIGRESYAGSVSYAFGYKALASAPTSVAIGRHVKTNSSNSMAIGITDGQSYLTNNKQYSLAIGFNSENPTFFVSETPFGYQSGSIGIGNVTDPQAKLHIRADAQEDATLRLEATGSGKHARMYFTGEHHITAGNDDDFRFRTTDGRNFIFQNGDIYMEDINFGIIMKSPNGQCWRGVMTDDGALSFSQVNCPGEASSVQNLPAEEGKFKAYPNPTTGNLIIESELYGNNTEIAISSLEGKTMLRQMITSARTEVSLKSFEPGTYILQLLSNGQLVESRKIVKH
jgi:hypothetical protein